MWVRCIGSGNAFGAGGRLNTSFFISTAAKGILLDCGASTLIGLNKINLSTADVDPIFITHLHGDHFGGLAFFLCEIISMKRRSKPLTIAGPEGIEERTLESLRCFYPGVELTNDDRRVRFFVYRAGEDFVIEGIAVKPFPAIHSPGTNPHILRIEADNKVITFSGDTQWTDELLAASDGADLFICEASAWQAPATHHLSVKELTGQRSRIRAKKIVLTHFGDDTLNHLHEIPFPLAYDGCILMNEEQT